MALPDYLAALDHAVALLAHIQDEARDWRATAINLTNSAAASTITFENSVAVGLPSFTCIACNLPKGLSVRSECKPTQSEAFDNLIGKLRNLSLPQQRTPVKKKKAPATKASTSAAAKTVSSMQVKCPRVAPATDSGPLARPATDKVASQVEEARSSMFEQKASAAFSRLSDARSRWRICHAHLLSLSDRSAKDNARLKVLSEFLALCDPLRKYELEPIRRREVVHSLLGELLADAKDPLRERSWLDVATLRTLADKPFVEAGTNVCVSERFKTWCARSGLLATTLLGSLIDRQLLRRDAKGLLSMSTLGSNLLERALTSGMKDGALGTRLSTSTLAQIEELRSHLLS